MANTLGIIEVVYADLADISSQVNTIADDAGSPRKATSDAHRPAVVRVTDHPVNDAGETGDDVSKMALFTNKCQGDTWLLGAAKLGTAVDSQDWATPE